jgi:hypothetical protein
MILFSCEEEESKNYGNPSIQIVSEPGFVSGDTTIAVNQIFKIKINAEFNGHNKLTNFIVKLNDERYLDLGIYQSSYDRIIEIPKGLIDVENWEFIIRDIEGNYASTGLTVYKDPNIVYGEIDEFIDIKLGAQNNTETGSFFSFSNGNVYSLQEAYNNQEIIDLVYYYDDFEKLEESIISSPGGNIDAAFTGDYGMSNWLTRNTIRYGREKLPITIEQFDQANNDSLLISNSFAFESGGRKTKFLEPGDIYSFVREDNVKGIFKVVSTSGTSAGYITVDIKIQKQ